MKTFLTLLLCAVSVFGLAQKQDYYRSQKINVLPLDSSNYYQIGQNAVITTPLPEEPFAYYFQKETDEKTITGFVISYPKTTVVTPNYEQQKEWKKLTPEMRSKIKLQQQDFRYTFDSATKTVKKDILINPWYTFIKARKPAAGEAVIYYSEPYSAKTDWEDIPTTVEFVRNFEKRNNLKIGDIYLDKKTNTVHFTLQGLKPEMIEAFVTDRRLSEIHNAKLKCIEWSPLLITPKILKIEKSWEKIKF